MKGARGISMLDVKSIHHRGQVGSAGAVTLVVVALLLVLCGGGYLYLTSGDDSQFADARKAWGRSDWDASIRMLEHTHRAEPTSPLPQYMLGIAHFESRNAAKADHYLASLSRNPEWASRAFYFRVLNHLREGETEKAAQMIDDVLPSLKQSPLAQEAQGLASLELAAAAEKRAMTLLTSKIGSARAGAYEDRVHRIVFADSTVFARSVDHLMERLHDVDRIENTAELRVELDRGHKHVITAANAFEKAVEIAKTTKKEPDPQRSRFELASIFAVRGRALEAEALFRDVIAVPAASMQDDPYFNDRRDGLVLLSRKNIAEFQIRTKRLAKAIETLSAIKLNDPKDDAAVKRPYDVDVMLAETYGEMGRTDKMLEIAGDWLDKDSSLFAMNYLIGRHYFDQGEHEKALPYLERARAKRVTGEVYTQTLVECLLELGRFQNANGLTEQLITVNPRDEGHYILRARALEGLGWKDDARKFLVQALRRRFEDGGTQAHRRLRRHLDAMLVRQDMLPKTLEDATRMYEDDPGSFLVAQRYIQILTKAENYRSAQSIVDSMRKECPGDHPQYPELMLACAGLSAARERWNEALGDLEGVIAQRPTCVEAHLGQAEAHLELGNFGPALEAIEKAELLEPASPRAARLRFELHLQENDWAEAAKIGEKLLAAEPRNGALLRSTATAYVKSGQPESAGKMLDKLKSVSLTDDDAIDYGTLLLDAGRVIEGERQLVRLIEDDPGDVKRALEIGRTLFQRERFEAVLRGLGPVAEANPETAVEAYKLMALAHSRLGQDEESIEAVTHLRGLGERAWIYERIADFCLARANLDEATSIIDAAIAEEVMTPELLVKAVDLAIAMRHPERAVEYATLLERDTRMSPAQSAPAIARAYGAQRNVPRAMKAIANGLEGASAREAKALYAAELEVLGRGGWTDKMLEVAVAAQKQLADSSGLADILTEMLMLADRPEAVDVAEQTIVKDGPTWRNQLNHGLLALDRPDAAAALADVEAAWALQKNPEVAHALGVLGAAFAKRSAVDAVLRPKSADAFPLHPLTAPAMAFVAAFVKTKGKDVAREAAALPFGSTSEREAFLAAVLELSAQPDTAELLRDELVRYFVFAGFDRTYAKAVKGLARLAEKAPAHKRAFDLMAARLEIEGEWSYTSGIQRATELMKDQDDEAAYMIYARGYILSGDAKSLNGLTDYVLGRRTFRAEFLRDYAQLLLNGRYPLDAARVISTSLEESPERRILEADALYRAGNVKRAAQILLEGPPVPPSATASQILAEYHAETPATLEEAFRLAGDAVYKFQRPHSSVYLTLARVSMKRGFVEEARKAIRKYISLAPSSARAAFAALQVVSEGGDSYAELKDWLESRRELLDPSQRVTTRRR
jgi:tetratricopeptide (TPR) repeat protein